MRTDRPTEAMSHSDATAELSETVARGATVLREKPLAEAARAAINPETNFMID